MIGGFFKYRVKMFCKVNRLVLLQTAEKKYFFSSLLYYKWRDFEILTLTINHYFKIEILLKQYMHK